MRLDEINNWMPTLNKEPEPTGKYNKGKRGSPGPYKLSDEAVRDIRIRFHRKGESIDRIHSIYPDVVRKTIEDIVKYKIRLSPACEINEAVNNEMSEEDQLEMVRKLPTSIWKIKNPSERVQLTAVEYNIHALEEILDAGIVPSDAVILLALEGEPDEQEGLILDWLKKAKIKLSEEVQLAIVIRNPYNILEILAMNIVPSEQVQLETVKREGRAIIWFVESGITPSSQVIRTALTNPRFLTSYTYDQAVKLVYPNNEGMYKKWMRYRENNQ